MTHVRVFSRKDAWNVANTIFPTDYIMNVELTERAGYPVYTSTSNDSDAYISDLGCRLEVNLYSDDMEDVTIWIDEVGSALTEEVKPSAGDTWNRENISISYRTYKWYMDVIQNTID